MSAMRRQLAAAEALGGALETAEEGATVGLDEGTTAGVLHEARTRATSTKRRQNTGARLRL